MCLDWLQDALHLEAFTSTSAAAAPNYLKLRVIFRHVTPAADSGKLKPFFFYAQKRHVGCSALTKILVQVHALPS